MKNEKKQTAVEWYAIEMAEYLRSMYGDGIINIDILKQAKEMEKERMIEFADNYVDNCVIPNDNMAIPTIMDVPNYYNETYGGNDQ
jgi:hypothetical protein